MTLVLKTSWGFCHVLMKTLVIEGDSWKRNSKKTIKRGKYRLYNFLDTSNIDFYNSYVNIGEINIEKKKKRKRRKNVEIV